MSLSKLVKSLFLASAVGIVGCVQKYYFNVRDIPSDPYKVYYLDDKKGNYFGHHAILWNSLLVDEGFKEHMLSINQTKEKICFVLEKDGKKYEYNLDAGNGFYEFFWSEKSSPIMKGPFYRMSDEELFWVTNPRVFHSK